MELPEGHVRAFRKTFDISVGAPSASVEEAVEYFREMIGDVYVPGGVHVVVEQIYGFEGREPVDESGFSMYPAKATLAALTDTASQATAAFSALVGSVSGGPRMMSEVSFDATDSTPPEVGTIEPPDHLRSATSSG